MLTIRSILHPTDFSACAEVAFAHALHLARHAQAAIDILHIAPAFRGHHLQDAFMATVDEKTFFEHVREDSLAQIDRLLDMFDIGDVHIRPLFQLGMAVGPAILKHVAREKTDLIVMGTHGRRGMRHLLLGSVTEEVVRKAPCSVLTVREPEDNYDVTLLSIRKILVPIDFSPHSHEALSQARQLAARFDASLELLFVAEERVVPIFSDTGLPSFSLIKLDDDVTDRAEEALRQLIAGTPGPDIPHAVAIRHGHPAREIATYAREQDIDLIVMTTRGLGSFERGLLGSVTERVVRTASPPVWVLHVPVDVPVEVEPGF